MGLKVSRRVVYAGTIVAMVAMIGGLALAASGFGTISTTGAGQNGYTGATAGTVWAGAVSLQGVGGLAAQTPCVSSGTGSTITNGAGTGATDTLYYYGTGAGACAQNDFYEEFIFSPATPVTGTSTDTFTLYSDVSGAYVQFSLTVNPGAGGSIGHLDVWVDYTIGGEPTIPGSVGAFVQGS